MLPFLYRFVVACCPSAPLCLDLSYKLYFKISVRLINGGSVVLNVWRDHGLTVKSSRLTTMAKGMPMFSLADTTHPPKGMTAWVRNTPRHHLECWACSHPINKHIFHYVLDFVTGVQRRCSGSPWGGCWSSCCCQSSSSRSLHSRARSCLWWWRIFVPRKTMKTAVSQSCGTERNRRPPTTSTQNWLVWWCVTAVDRYIIKNNIPQTF